MAFKVSQDEKNLKMIPSSFAKEDFTTSFVNGWQSQLIRVVVFTGMFTVCSGRVSNLHKASAGDGQSTSI